MGGKILYCHEVAGVAMGLHIFKQTKNNQKKKQRCTFYSIREAKLPFISKKMVSEKFEPGKNLESAICNLFPFKRKRA